MSEVLDIETTGLSFRDNHKIVEMHVLKQRINSHKKIFHTLVNPERDVPDVLLEFMVIL